MSSGNASLITSRPPQEIDPRSVGLATALARLYVSERRPPAGPIEPTLPIYNKAMVYVGKVKRQDYFDWLESALAEYQNGQISEKGVVMKVIGKLTADGKRSLLHDLLAFLPEQWSAGYEDENGRKLYIISTIDGVGSENGAELVMVTTADKETSEFGRFPKRNP